MSIYKTVEKPGIILKELQNNVFFVALSRENRYDTKWLYGRDKKQNNSFLLRSLLDTDVSVSQILR